jgi:hypothetical protein
MADVADTADTSDALDGNVVAGALAELFRMDMTTAVTTCAGCGDRHPVGELRAHVDAPGIVLRCTGCAAVQIRLVRAPNRAWIDLRGVAVLQVALDDEPPA